MAENSAQCEAESKLFKEVYEQKRDDVIRAFYEEKRKIGEEKWTTSSDDEKVNLLQGNPEYQHALQEYRNAEADYLAALTRHKTALKQHVAALKQGVADSKKI